MRLFPAPWGNYLLEGFVETTPPDMVSLIPSTLGWQIVYLLLAIFACKKLYGKYIEYKRNAYRRNALKVLNGFKAKDLPLDVQRKLPALLRTTALFAYNREEISQITGKEWEIWLDQQCESCLFSTTFSGMLHALSFAPTINFTQQQTQGLIEQMIIWVESHRRVDHA